MDVDTGHIKMTRVFRTSIITQLNRLNRSFLTPNVRLSRSFIKTKWNMFAISDDLSLYIYTLFQILGV